ncbi:MAG TPA: hypothetical protein VFE50_07275 [Cyclobacteriaceae bacterium]|nr:hypothetical protein [Cyclobacteriaceae bacterium]
MIIIGLAVRPVVVLIHLLAHALTAIAITEQKTTIYLGSYGDQEKSAKVSIGLLDVWFTVIPFLWQIGICIPTDKVPLKFEQKLSYTLAGPLMPVAISGVILLIAAVAGFNPFVVFTLNALFYAAVVDLFINFIPRDKPIFTDGYSLKLLLTRKKYPTEFFVALDEFSRHDYVAAAKHFEKASRIMPQKKNIHEFYLKAKELAS